VGGHAAAELTSAYIDESVSWSPPLVTMMGQMQLRESVMARLSLTCVARTRPGLQMSTHGRRTAADGSPWA
jgi:hypothetical protein